MFAGEAKPHQLQNMLTSDFNELQQPEFNAFCFTKDQVYFKEICIFC